MTRIKQNATPPDIDAEIRAEMDRSSRIHVEYFRSVREGVGVITEEYFETVEAFRLSKDKYPEGNTKLRIELTQVAAMCRKLVVSQLFTPMRDREAVRDDFDRKLARVEGMKRYCSTMDALGDIALSFARLNARFLNDSYIYSDIQDSLIDLACCCKSAILSCCVAAPEEIEIVRDFEVEFRN